LKELFDFIIFKVMLFKRWLSSSLLLAIVFLILLTTSRVDVLATSVTIQTNFLTSSTWFNASGQAVTGDTITGSPYRILTNDYNYLLSVGSNDVGSNRVLFGATSLQTANDYGDFDHPNLAAFRSLTRNHNFEGVITQLDTFYYVKFTSVQLQWGTGSTPEGYQANLIYTTNEGLSWSTVGTTQTITPGPSAGSFTFNDIIQSSYLKVGIFLTNNTNGNSIYIQNPELNLTYPNMTNQEQANQFASEIEDYSLCATVENGMIQLTTPKQHEFIDKYQRLTPEAKSFLNSIPMGVGFTAMDRYLLLINGTI
jgi:hypothetical protein